MTTEELKAFLSTPRKIFITTHSKPDGDALGSSLAMYHYLLKKGHEPTVVSPSDYGVYLHWMPGNPAVLCLPGAKDKALKHLSEAELIFCLDFNNHARTEHLADALRKATAPKVMIDHHLEPEGFETYRLWNPDACATTELVYKFMEDMGDLDLLDKNIATCIYTGLITDSGSFRYPNVTANVHRIVAGLMDVGLEHWQVHTRIFDTFTEKRLRFFGLCIKDKLVILPEYRAAYISVSKEEIREFEIKTGETEGLVNYPLTLSEVVFAALIIDREHIIKLSLRSKGNFPANEFASKYFEGGGHLNAAGGSYKGNLAGAEDNFLRGLEEYKPLLLNM
jgi:bifunctional oligoribonuclease and PAP phosphatase NrnA